MLFSALCVSVEAALFKGRTWNGFSSFLEQVPQTYRVVPQCRAFDSSPDFSPVTQAGTDAPTA